MHLATDHGESNIGWLSLELVGFIAGRRTPASTEDVINIDSVCSVIEYLPEIIARLGLIRRKLAHAAIVHRPILVPVHADERMPVIQVDRSRRGVIQPVGDAITDHHTL